VSANKSGKVVYAGADGLFRDDSVEVVIDNDTGLMWQDELKSSEDIMIWIEAYFYCDSLSLAGYDDWRMPNTYELKSVVDKSRKPKVKSVFKSIISSGYWSSAIGKIDPSNSELLNFQNGFTGVATNNIEFNTRCVRDIKTSKESKKKSAGFFGSILPFANDDMQFAVIVDNDLKVFRGIDKKEILIKNRVSSFFQQYEVYNTIRSKFVFGDDDRKYYSELNGSVFSDPKSNYISAKLEKNKFLKGFISSRNIEEKVNISFDPNLKDKKSTNINTNDLYYVFKVHKENGKVKSYLIGRSMRLKASEVEFGLIGWIGSESFVIWDSVKALGFNYDIKTKGNIYISVNGIGKYDKFVVDKSNEVENVSINTREIFPIISKSKEAYKVIYRRNNVNQFGYVREEDIAKKRVFIEYVLLSKKNIERIKVYTQLLSDSLYSYNPNEESIFYNKIKKAVKALTGYDIRPTENISEVFEQYNRWSISYNELNKSSIELARYIANVENKQRIRKKLEDVIFKLDSVLLEVEVSDQVWDDESEKYYSEVHYKSRSANPYFFSINDSFFKIIYNQEDRRASGLAWLPLDIIGGGYYKSIIDDANTISSGDRENGYIRDSKLKIVKDNFKKLTWQDDVTDEVPMVWIEAYFYCDGLDLGGHEDWRLPSAAELQSIVDINKTRNIHNAFKNIKQAGYWSSTIDSARPSYSIIIDFVNGESRFYKNSYEMNVRCVR